MKQKLIKYLAKNPSTVNFALVGLLYSLFLFVKYCAVIMLFICFSAFVVLLIFEPLGISQHVYSFTVFFVVCMLVILGIVK